MLKRNFVCVFFLGLVSLAMAQSPSDVRIKHIVAPEYPRLSWFAQLQGTVQVEVEFDADGKVLSATGRGAHNLLNRAAEENVRCWTFAPNPSGMSTIKINYIYKLEGKKEHELMQARVEFDLPDVITIIAHPPAPGGY